MNKTPETSKDAADKLVRGIKRKTRKHYSAEEKIRIVLAGAGFTFQVRHRGWQRRLRSGCGSRGTSEGWC
jgi:hypothetical protein